MATLTTCTSSTRPGSPADGDMLFETDTGSSILWDAGSAVWREYLPATRPYDLDGTSVLTATPQWHFDAMKVNGVDASGNLADDTTFDSNYTWTSRSVINGTRASCTQITASTQPVYNTGGTNSQNFMYFSADYLALKEFDEISVAGIYPRMSNDFSQAHCWLKGPFPYLQVVNPDTHIISSSAFTQNLAVDAGAAAAELWFSWSGNIDYKIYSGFAAQAYPAWTSGSGNDGTATEVRDVLRMYVITRNASDEMLMYTDGHTNGVTALVYSGAVQTKDIGRGKAVNYCTIGECYEEAIWDGELSTADLAKLTTYVNTKYGVGRNADDTADLARVAITTY